MTDIRAKIDGWKKLAEAVSDSRKWYTADELLNRRAMPEADGALIAAMSPVNVLALIAECERLSAPLPNVQEIHRDFGEHDDPPRGRFQDMPVEADVALMVERLREGAGHEPADIQSAEQVMDQAADMLTRLYRQSAAGAEVLAEREAAAKIADHEVSEFERLAIAAGETDPHHRALYASCLSVALGIAAAIRARSAPPVAAGEEG